MEGISASNFLSRAILIIVGQQGIDFFLPFSVFLKQKNNKKRDIASDSEQNYCSMVFDSEQKSGDSLMKTLDDFEIRDSHEIISGIFFFKHTQIKLV